MIESISLSTETCSFIPLRYNLQTLVFVRDYGYKLCVLFPRTAPTYLHLSRCLWRWFGFALFGPFLLVIRSGLAHLRVRSKESECHEYFAYKEWYDRHSPAKRIHRFSHSDDIEAYRPLMK